MDYVNNFCCFLNANEFIISFGQEKPSLNKSGKVKNSLEPVVSVVMTPAMALNLKGQIEQMFASVLEQRVQQIEKQQTPEQPAPEQQQE